MPKETPVIVECSLTREQYYEAIYAANRIQSFAHLGESLNLEEEDNREAVGHMLRTFVADAATIEDLLSRGQLAAYKPEPSGAR